MITGILLAAGESKRFGGNKLLIEIEDLPLVCHSLGHCVASRLTEIHVVVGVDGSELEDQIARHFGGEPRIHIDRNEDPSRGMMSSLKTGLRSVLGRCDGAMVIHADMPLVTAAIINELISVFEREQTLVIPESGGRLQHPRIIPERMFGDFLELADDEKGAKVIKKYQDRDDVVRVSIGTDANYVDIDNPDDLDVFKRL